MTDRYDVLSVRESNGKAYFTKCGAMFANKNGDGWNILLSVIPAPEDGQFRLIAKVPQQQDDRARSASNDRQQARERGNGGGYGSRPQSDDMDDSIPFARNDTVW